MPLIIGSQDPKVHNVGDSQGVSTRRADLRPTKPWWLRGPSLRSTHRGTSGPRHGTRSGSLGIHPSSIPDPDPQRKADLIAALSATDTPKPKKPTLPNKPTLDRPVVQAETKPSFSERLAAPARAALGWTLIAAGGVSTVLPIPLGLPLIAAGVVVLGPKNRALCNARFKLKRYLDRHDDGPSLGAGIVRSAVKVINKIEDKAGFTAHDAQAHRAAA